MEENVSNQNRFLQRAKTEILKKTCIMRGSMAVRTATAGLSILSHTRILVLITTITLVILSVNFLSFIIMYGIFRGGTDFSNGMATATCFDALKDSEFDLLDTSKYGDWFHESSVMTLAETGTFVGITDITEYIKFTQFKPYFSVWKTVEAYPSVITPVSLTDDECVVNFVARRVGYTNTTNGEPLCVHTATASTMYFTAKPKFQINRLNVWLSKYFQELTFHSLETDRITDMFCSVLEKKCPDVFKLNDLNNHETCVDKFKSLPFIDDGSYLDGNTTSCRNLHVVLASMNADHCPHLSFIPLADKKGQFKCQTSANIKPEDLFSEYELDVIHDAAVLKLHLPADTYTEHCEIDQNDDFFLDDNEKDLNIKNPLGSLSTQGFLTYISFFMWVTMVTTGIGTEFFMFSLFIRGKWDQETEGRWKLAQFLFSLFAATAIGLALSHNYLSMFFVVIACWKLGFPETILTLHSAIYDEKISRLTRISDAFDFVGTAIHHSAACMYVAIVVTGLIPPTREVIQGPIPTLAQHWFVLLRYTDHKNIYAVIETILEVWFEWSLISVLEVLHKLHWSASMTVGTMLFSHWCYFLGAILRTIHKSLKKDTDDVYNRTETIRMSVICKNGYDVCGNKENELQPLDDNKRQADFGVNVDKKIELPKGLSFNN